MDTDQFNNPHHHTLPISDLSHPIPFFIQQEEPSCEGVSEEDLTDISFVAVLSSN